MLLRVLNSSLLGLAGIVGDLLNSTLFLCKVGICTFPDHSVIERLNRMDFVICFILSSQGTTVITLVVFLIILFVLIFVIKTL